MAIIDCKYTLSSEGYKLIAGCAAKQLIDEQSNAISNAFQQVSVSIEIDDDWGFCKIIAINGRRVEE